VSNLPFSEWGKAVTDTRLEADMVDRVTFNGHIIETGTGSYRLASTRAKRGGKKT
jgi:DNA replication protein DnaC